MLARLAADLDHLSGGRLILGLGIGWNADEFAQLGMPFPSVHDRQEALDEALAIIAGVWGPEPFSFTGRHWSTCGGHVDPPPVQRPRPPIMIAGSGERVTLRQVAEHADICNFGSGRNVGKVVSREDIARKFAVLRDHCGRFSRPYDEIIRSHFTTCLMLAATESDANAKLDRYYPDGLNEDQRLTRIHGTPAQAIAYFQDLADAGFQYFVVQVLDAADRETFRLLAEEVMPHVHPQRAHS